MICYDLIYNRQQQEAMQKQIAEQEQIAKEQLAQQQQEDAEAEAEAEAEERHQGEQQQQQQEEHQQGILKDGKRMHQNADGIATRPYCIFATISFLLLKIHFYVLLVLSLPHISIIHSKLI